MKGAGKFIESISFLFLFVLINQGILRAFPFTAFSDDRKRDCLLERTLRREEAMPSLLFEYTKCALQTLTFPM